MTGAGGAKPGGGGGGGLSGGGAGIRVGGACEKLGRGLRRSLGGLSGWQPSGRPLQIGPSGIPGAASGVFRFAPLPLSFRFGDKQKGRGA